MRDGRVGVLLVHFFSARKCTHLGLEWLWSVYCNEYGGGILGDDMGLGACVCCV